MIGWGDVYKVVVAMAPLYFALLLGYASVKWWRIFTGDQGDAINRLVCYFTLPLFTLDFTAHVNPFDWNLRFLAADVVSKAVIAAVLVLWAKCSARGSYAWSITAFSLSTLTNSLIIGVPLMKAMYGQTGVDLVVQSTVFQSIVWFTTVLFVLELRRSGMDVSVEEIGKDLEGNDETPEVMISSRPSFCRLMRVVLLKLAMNPNSYACMIGLAWAFVANRWHVEMPSIIEGSISILSRAGSGTAMFSIGIFMAQQERMVACGTSLAALGMVLRFIAGPAAMAIASVALGLHSQVLRVAIIQAALPQAIGSFIFAKQYGLHAEVLSTAVIFGTMLSLPVLIAYYAVLEFVH